MNSNFNTLSEKIRTLSAVKRLPAVIVSSRAYNLAKPDVVIMAITSQIHKPASLGEVLIGKWQSANLLKPSVVKPFFATSVFQVLPIRRSCGKQSQPYCAIDHLGGANTSTSYLVNIRDLVSGR